ncbi:TPA: hypothetical protein KMV34_003706 [Escherichia coli]|nr:hypothetical protein [Escherichia coli]
MAFANVEQDINYRLVRAIAQIDGAFKLARHSDLSAENIRYPEIQITYVMGVDVDYLMNIQGLLNSHNPLLFRMGETELDEAGNMNGITPEKMIPSNSPCITLIQSRMMLHIFRFPNLLMIILE